MSMPMLPGETSPSRQGGMYSQGGYDQGGYEQGGYAQLQGGGGGRGGSPARSQGGRALRSLFIVYWYTLASWAITDS